MKADDRRGVALIIAVAVLTAMFLMAVPFAVFMRLQHSAGTQALHTARARNGYTGALGYARNVLYQGSYYDGMLDAPFQSADVDTLWEFRATMRTVVEETELQYADVDEDGRDDVAERKFGVKSALGLPNDGDPDTLDGYLRVGEEWVGYYDVDIDTEVGQFPGGTVTVRRQDRGAFGTSADDHGTGTLVSVFPELEMWHLDVQDQQALINVNTAPYQVILNLLQYLEIAGPAPPNTPSVEQMNLAAAISAYRLYYSFWEGEGEQGAIKDGSYTRFQNLSAVRNISKAPWLGAGGTPTLTADDFDRLRPYLTVHSEAPGELWWDVTYTQGDLNGASAHTEHWAVQLNNAGQIPVGGIVRLGDSQDDPVRMVNSVNRTVTLGAGGLALAQTGPVSVTGSLADFALLDSTTNPGADAHTPGYLYIDDGANSEWIAYSDVDAGANQIHVSERGLWGTSDVAHAAGVTMQGNVIGWRYDAGSGLVDSNDERMYVGGVQVNYTPAVGETISNGSTLQLERRHAVNVNTVTDPVILQALAYGVSDGTDTIDESNAGTFASGLLEYTSGAAGPPYDFFDGNEEWFDYTDPSDNPTTPRAEFEDFIASLGFGVGDEQLLKDNFRDVPASWPAVSTCPLRFNSGALTGIASMGMADDRAHTPVAQYPRLARSRVYDTVPPLEGLIWALRSQKEFYDWMALSGQREADGGHILTGRLLERLPGALLADDDDWATADEGVGTVMPALGILEPHRYVTCLMGLHSPTVNDFDLDYSAAADTAMVGPATADTDNTTYGGIRDVQLEYDTHYDAAAGNRHIEADSFHAVVQPFAVEFWIRPARHALNRQLILDVGEGEAEEPDAESQVRLYLQNRRLVLRMDEPVDDADAGYSGYVEARSGLTFEPGRWHYVAVAAVGPFKDEIAMFVDGIYDSGMTWLYGDDDEAAVQEGCFLPLAMTWPNRNTTTTIGPVGGEWAARQYGARRAGQGLAARARLRGRLLDRRMLPLPGVRHRGPGGRHHRGRAAAGEGAGAGARAGRPGGPGAAPDPRDGPQGRHALL